MKISDAMIRYYLDYLTFHPFGADDDPPEPGALDRYIRDMKALAAKRGDMEPLHAFFDRVLADPGFDLAPFQSAYPFTDDELREMLGYAHGKLWPRAPVTAADFEIVPMELEDWWTSRGQEIAQE